METQFVELKNNPNVFNGLAIFESYSSPPPKYLNEKCMIAGPSASVVTENDYAALFSFGWVPHIIYDRWVFIAD
jgi:hypothetical protein